MVERDDERPQGQPGEEDAARHTSSLNVRGLVCERPREAGVDSVSVSGFLQR
jgi:hypothetical protein